MEDKINELKKLYFSEKAPMSAEEGFEDVLVRLERENQTALLRPRFLYIGLAILVLAVLLSSVFILPESTATQAIKNAPINLYNSLFAPSVTPVDSQTEKINAKPTSAPTPTTGKQTPDENSQAAPGKSISETKRSQNSTSNNEKVKGVSDQHTPSIIPANPNTPNNSNVSEEKRNENSLDNPGTNGNPGNGNKPDSNPAQEKSNGKAKNN